MRIDSSEVNLQASSSFIQKYEKNVSATSFTKTENIDEQKAAQSDINIEPKKLVFNSEADLSVEDKVKKRIIEELLSRLLHSDQKIKLFPNDSENSAQSSNNPYAQKNSEWGFSYESKEEYYEKTTMDFSAEATIKTSNGEFKINLSLSYSNEFYQRNETSINAHGRGENPFLVDMQKDGGNYDNVPREMGFEFDVNKDKKNSDISSLENNVSYLALDKSGNGKIDDGNELFGVNSGDGFKELSAYDEDGNNWIDENDSVFNDLRVWEKKANGENSLVSLADSGIGAIYLSNVSSVNGGQSSIFLKENGDAGVIGSVDYRV
ncbi:MAG: hypothetical protein ACNI28_04960 [Arcobacter sp.]|uniref:hypothetical protein n=1 Tax=Arcobacter sp. TaxID=1872629 RepID=UPI003B00BA6A